MDIWAVGCIMAEMVRHKILFPGRDCILELLAAVSGSCYETERGTLASVLSSNDSLVCLLHILLFPAICPTLHFAAISCFYRRVLTQLTHLNSTTVAPNITQELKFHYPVAKNETFYCCSCAETLCELRNVICMLFICLSTWFIFTFSVIWWCVSVVVCIGLFFSPPALHANWVVVISFFSWCLVCWLHHGWNGPG